VGMTRAMERLTLTHAMARSLYGRRDYNLPSRFLDELPAAVVRERLRPASWSNFGAPAMAPIHPNAEIPELRMGDSVRHGSLGEGVVIAVEPGGVVVVRFSGESSDRRLMLEYAPLEKIA
jgi:DNA helicase II / ATP-dependent DNA helicase PcrA